MFQPFFNEPYSDFSVPANEAAYRLALAGVREQLGAHYPLVIGDEQVAGGGAARPSLASLLETALRAELSDAAVEVVDGGAAGYTFQNYLGALDNLLALGPDACVLVVSSGNDLFEALRLESLLDQRPFPRRLERYAEELRRAAAAQPAAVEQGLASARYFEEHRPQGKRAFELAVQITAELRRVCDQHGIHLTVAHVPPASALEWGDHAAVLAEAAELLGVGERYLDANQRLVAPYLDQLAQADHDLLELEELAVDGPVFGRDLLLSPAGLTALAEALARRLAAPLAQSR